MYAKVRFLNGWNRRLTYKIPENWDIEDYVGTLVKVPIQKRVEFGVIESVSNKTDNETRALLALKKIREIQSYDKLTSALRYKDFIEKVSRYYLVEPMVFLKRLVGFLESRKTSLRKERIKTESSKKSGEKKNIVVLSSEQESTLKKILVQFELSENIPCVLQGVTGSGKTEIYRRLIEKNFLDGKSTIFLVPEVSLALKFTDFFKSCRENLGLVFGFHSGIKKSEKQEILEKLISNVPVLIVGVHLPVLLPIENLGLIIIDEEHDAGWQEKKQPRFNTKELALFRSKYDRVPIILGSATPSVTTLYNVKKLGWRLFEMKNRFLGKFPKVEVVKLNQVKKGQFFWISSQLKQAIKDRLSKKEQVMLFLNRRGYSFLVQCLSCGFIFGCKNCSVSLTYHSGGFLQCHYCGFKTDNKRVCGSCNSKKLLKKGVGTQQIVKYLSDIFPEAIIERADADRLKKKGEWEMISQKFEQGKIDLLVGTQVIAKGHHFKNVTLVGILWADMHLGFPIYNATEVSLQQIIQVAGRTGRGSKEGLVIIQAIKDHEVLEYVQESSYKRFYEFEIEKRKELSYPPIIRLAEIELRYGDEELVKQESIKVFNLLKKVNRENTLNVRIFGPAQPPVAKIKRVITYKIYLKAQKNSQLIFLYKSIDLSRYKSSIFFTPNPLSL